jgi:hypothetical protein
MDFLLDQCQKAHAQFASQGTLNLNLLSQVLTTSQALFQVNYYLYRAFTYKTHFKVTLGSILPGDFSCSTVGRILTI